MSTIIAIWIGDLVFTLLAPKWTLAGIDALAGPVDWFFAILIALVPAVLIAWRCSLWRRASALLEPLPAEFARQPFTFYAGLFGLLFGALSV